MLRKVLRKVLSKGCINDALTESVNRKYVMYSAQARTLRHKIWKREVTSRTSFSLSSDQPLVSVSEELASKSSAVSLYVWSGCDEMGLKFISAVKFGHHF